MRRFPLFFLTIPRLVTGAAVVALALSGCTDPADKAAKKRIFSPEDPPQAVAAASQKLPPQDVADDPAIARRVLGMSAAEATERLGAHHYTATIDWEWTQSSGKSVRLKETRDLLAGAGGVSGDFHAQLSNTNNSGLEVLRVGGRVFARNTYGKDGEGKFRERKRDRGIAERLRDESFGALRDLDQLFRGRLKLTTQSSAESTASFGDRTAWKYSVSLGDALPESASKLPPVVTPKNGVDETTRRRQHFYEARTPVSLQGEILVDAKTSVVLKAHVVGRLSVKGDADGGTADSELRITVDSALSDIGASPSIAVPADFLPDEDKPDGVAAALQRFGVERGDAGVSIVPASGKPAAEQGDDAPPDALAPDAIDDDDSATPKPATGAPSTGPKPTPKVTKPPPTTTPSVDTDATKADSKPEGKPDGGKPAKVKKPKKK